MRNVKYFILGALLMTLTGFIPLDNTLSIKKSSHISSTIGRKAWLAFNGDLSSIREKRITKFGFNKDLDAASNEILASFGGAWLQKGLSAETLTIVSTGPNAANDDSGGTGATNILITCIDEDGLEVLVPVVMDGTTPVVTTQTCKFVNRAVVFLSGTSDWNEGNISITQTTSGVQLAEIPATKSATQQLLYYVPSDRRCYIDKLELRARKISGGNTNIRVEFNVLVYSQTQDTIYDIREFFFDTRIDSNIDLDDFKAEQVRPNEIITVDMDSDTDDSIVTGSMELTCLLD